MAPMTLTKIKRMLFKKRPIRVISFGKTSVHRLYTNSFLREYGADLSPRSVLNIGDAPDAPDKEGKTYEDYFPRATFKTLDLAHRDHPRHIEGDLMVPGDYGTYDLVLLMSVIEHIDRPWIAAPNIVKLLNRGGYLYIAMPFMYPVHEGPYYGDHWRARPSAMKFLFPDLIEIKADTHPSSIKVVKDRRMYWNEPQACSSGFSMLLQKPF